MKDETDSERFIKLVMEIRKLSRQEAIDWIHDFKKMIENTKI